MNQSHLMQLQLYQALKRFLKIWEATQQKLRLNSNLKQY